MTDSDEFIIFVQNMIASCELYNKFNDQRKK